MRISFLFLLMTFLWGACADEEVLIDDWAALKPSPGVVTRAPLYTSSLVKEGAYWRATQRIPLVGKGRIVDDYANALVTVLSSGSKMSHLVDEELTNCASFGGGLADVAAIANQIVSIRDLHRTYAPGQKVGFVFKVANSKLLTLDVLKSFWLQTFCNGQAQESFGNTTGSDVLKLDLVSIAHNDGIKELAFTATKPFDEVQFNIAGVSADVLKSLSIYYAFVGENECKTATSGSTYFPDARLSSKSLWSTMSAAHKVVNNDLTDYAYYSTLGGLVNDPMVTVDFGREVPAGSEVGFVISKVDVLNVGLGKTMVLKTYDANHRELETVSVNNVLDLSLVSVGNQSRISMKTLHPCRQLKILFQGVELKLGATNVYYAYARDAVSVDVSSLFSVADVTVSGLTYTLLTPKNGTTTWEVISAPAGTLPEIKKYVQGTTSATKIVGMTRDGDYRLRGTYVPAATGSELPQPVTVEMVIHRRALTMGQGCNQLLGTTAGASIGDIVGGGSLVSFGRFDYPERIVDDDPDNYATLVNPLALAANVGIGAVQLKQPINLTHQPIRVGFTIQTTFDLLGADALKFFQIRLYLKGQQQVSQIVDKSDVVDLSLIGSQGNKIRMGIKTKVAFDQIELWTVGLLNVKLQSFRLYNAYWENDTVDCPTEGIGEACMEMLTASQGAEINYDHTRMVGLVTAGACTEDLAHLLDDDRQNFAVANATKVGAANSLAIRFPPVPGGSKVGFVVAAPTGLADVGLLKHTTLQVWSNGTVAEDHITGDLLDVDVIGRTGRAYLEVLVTRVKEFDEVRIVFPAGVQALDTYKVYGAYVRRDTNGNGIPDCAEDAENPAETVVPIEATVINPHLCEGQELQIHVTKGGEVHTSYTLIAWNVSQQNQQRVLTQTLPASGVLTWPNLPAGEYFIRIQKNGKNVCQVLSAWVHPLRTTWRKNAPTTNWNAWANWSHGAPWTCTDVILPTGCVRYPELTSQPEYCANLHLASHAELVHASLLDHYDYAWMELTLQSGRSYLLSAPLSQMVTGDLFVPARFSGRHDGEAYFVKLDEATSLENRFAPRVYQRFWSSTVSGKVMQGNALGTTVITNETDWTAPFNAVAQEVRPGMGWMVRAEAEGLADSHLVFRFPKTHTAYTYFYATGQSTGQTEGVQRLPEAMGRFSFEDLTPTVAGSYSATVRNLKPGRTFVVGNPFPTHLTIAAFLQANANDVSEVKLTNGNGVHTVLLQQGQVVATAPGITHVAPMQAFYVTTRSERSELTVHFSLDMQEQMPGYDIYAWDREPAVFATRSVATDDALRITATAHGQSTHCVVRFREGASLDGKPGEDTPLLYDPENPPTVAVFTMAGHQAVDVQQVPLDEVEALALGWRLPRQAEVTLQVQCTSQHRAAPGWALLHRPSGRRIPLQSPETVVSLGKQSTQVGAWWLVKEP